jgi:hypothetical protein
VTPLSKTELKRQIKKFLHDKDRGISVALFAELSGVSKTMLMDVFYYEKEPLSEMVQRRVNKAYMQWKAGAVKIMKRQDNTRYVDYRRVAEPAIMHGMGLKVTSEGIKLRVGMVNRHDYSEIDLNEALRG